MIKHILSTCNEGISLKDSIPQVEEQNEFWAVCKTVQEKFTRTLGINRMPLKLQD